MYAASGRAIPKSLSFADNVFAPIRSVASPVVSRACCTPVETRSAPQMVELEGIEPSSRRTQQFFVSTITNDYSMRPSPARPRTFEDAPWHHETHRPPLSSGVDETLATTSQRRQGS